MYYDKSDSLIKNIAGIIANGDFLQECKYAFDDEGENAAEHTNSDFSDFFDDLTINLMESKCYGYYSNGTLPIEGCPVEAIAFNGKPICISRDGDDGEVLREAISYHIGALMAVLKNNMAYLHRLLQMDADGDEFSNQTVDYHTEVSRNHFSFSFDDDGVCGEIEQTIPFSVVHGNKYSYTNVAVVKKEDYEKERSKLSGIIGAKDNAYAQYARESKIFNDFSELVVTDLQNVNKYGVEIKMIRTILFAIDTENPERSIIDCITIYGNDILMPIIKSKQREMIDRKLSAIRDAFMEDNEIC